MTTSEVAHNSTIQLPISPHESGEVAVLKDSNRAFTTEFEFGNSFAYSTVSGELWTRSSPKFSSRMNVATGAESTCSEGQADWVWASFPREAQLPSQEHAWLFQQPTCSRILASLKPNAVRSVESLYKRAGVGPATFRKWLSALLKADLVKENDGTFVLGASFALPPLEIVAFEFKLHDWRRAYTQAKRYRSFSHRVFVVTPPKVASRMCDEIGDSMRRFNVGLISHASNGSSEVLLPSLKMQPKSRASFVQAVGFLSTNYDSNPASF